MCGIFGELSLSGDCLKRTISGIGNLEHRGYDSMGVVYGDKGKMKVAKIISPHQDKSAQDLYCEITNAEDFCSVALGHTRWATCGKISFNNTHPHKGEKSYLAHNGNIINVGKLKELLGSEDFVSETDSEVVVKLIDKYYSESGDLIASIEKVLSLATGANSFVLFNSDFPDKLFCASNGGPLLLGKTKDSVIIASDPAAFLGRNVKRENLYKIEHIVVVSHDSWEVIEKKRKNEIVDPLLDNGKGDYSHYMLKEIFEQPQTIKNALNGRIELDRGNSHLGGLHDIARNLRNVETFHFVGCGTAYNACLYGVALFNRFGIDARAWIASEFIYNHPYVKPNDAFIFVSQSGETADTIEVIKEIKMKGNICLGVVNVPDSRIASMTDAGVYIQSGIEKGVASTKAFTGMISIILLYAVFLARQRKMTIDTGIGILKMAQKLPQMVASIFEQKDKIKQMANKILKFDNMYFMGRSMNYIIAEEGGLKLKEITYKHAESYPLGEMKHGPLALISPDFCSVVIAPNDSVYAESLVNIKEILCRNGEVFVITSDNHDFGLPLNHIRIPALPQKYEFMYPFLTVIPLQLISYYIAVELGLNPDKPRNLAKSVTVN